MTMRIDRSEWRRKHDDRRAPALIPNPEAHFFPQSRLDLIDIVQRSLAPGVQNPAIRASGSHWALSEAAVTDRFVVETRGFSEPDGFPAPPLLNNTLYEVIPDCLTNQQLSDLTAQPERPYQGEIADGESYNYYHLEAGVRIFELYSRLDLRSQNVGDSTPLEFHMPTSRHPSTQGIAALKGPWAMPTLGGAGGQTLVGAFSTGTHGGDQHQTPIADAVQAIHLIGPDGREYWLERGFGPMQQALALVDDKKLRMVYPGITVIRDNDVFHAALVSVGRMGIIYSVVLKVARQYGLRQTRTIDTWRTIAPRLVNPTDPLFQSRFLQVVVNPHPKVDPLLMTLTDHTCYIEQREAVGLAEIGTWQGPTQRGDHPGTMPPIGTGDFQSWLCSRNASEIVLTLKGIIAAAMLALAIIPLGVLLIPVLVTLDIALTPFIGYTGSLGEVVTDLCNMALSLPTPLPGFVGVVNDAFLNFGQPEIPAPGRTDISYAIMDFHDYQSKGCVPSADSLTVSFNADEPHFITFMDGLFLRINELHAGTLVPPPAPGMPAMPIGTIMSFAGYASMRFTGKTEALIGMQRWNRTCNIEIAGIKGIRGTDPFLRRLEADATALGATVHWGQKHEASLAQVEATFPDLDRWRMVLARFTENGTLTNFSTPFSRTKGLEVVQPRIDTATVEYRYLCAGEPARLRWDALQNPAGTMLKLRVMPAIGMATEIDLPLQGGLDLSLPAGNHWVQWVALYTFGGTRREAVTPVEAITVFNNGDIHRIAGVASCRVIEGASRWAVTVPLNEHEWSPHLMAGNLYLARGSRALFVQKAEDPETILLTNPRVGVEFFNPTAMAGGWNLYLQAEGCTGAVPELAIDVRVRYG